MIKVNQYLKSSPSNFSIFHLVVQGEYLFAQVLLVGITALTTL